MGGERETKTCKTCYEQIDARARKCRHCRSRQHWLSRSLVWPVRKYEKPKTCKACYRDIDGRARKCPSCRTPQNHLAIASLNPRFVLGAVAVLLICYGPFVGYCTWWAFNLGGDFAPPSDELNILGHELAFGEDEEGRSVSILGKVRNESAVAWADVKLEAQFFNAEGILIDVGFKLAFRKPIRPGEEESFEVKVRPILSNERYVSHQLFLRSAREREDW